MQKMGAQKPPFRGGSKRLEKVAKIVLDILVRCFLLENRNMKKRRTASTLCLLATILPGARPGQAQAAGTQAAQALDPALGISTLQLWPSGAPEVAGTDPADLPTLTVFLPQQGRATGSAVIVAPGGSYVNLASNLEGRQVADWFTSRGLTAFVLKYRLGAKYLYPIPLQDAQRAIRLVRSSAAAYGFLPNRIGIIGFSAGGHLAAATGTLFDAGKPDASDPVERFSSRPDFMVLGYPWLNAMQPSGSYISYCSMIKSIPPETCKEDEQKYTPSLHVTPQTPTTFIYSTTDDRTVPISASVNFYNALQAAGVPAELHIFRRGEHGSGLGLGDAALDLWPMLLEQWMRDQGLLSKP
jgi:acetyl esterase/lipase